MRWYRSLSYQRKKEIFGFLIVVVALFTALSLATHSAGDDRWIRADPDEVWLDAYQARNMAGTVGALLSSALYEWFGLTAWALTLLLGAVGLNRFVQSVGRRPVVISVQIVAATYFLGVFVDLPRAAEGVAWEGGAGSIAGLMGRTFGIGLSELFGVVGSMLIVGAVLVGGVLFAIPREQLIRLKPKRRPRSVAKRDRTKSRNWMAPVAGLWQRTNVMLRNWVQELRRSPDDDSTEGEEFLADLAASDDGGANQDDLPNWAKYQSSTTLVRQPEPEPTPREQPSTSAQPRVVARTPQSADDEFRFPSLDLLDEGEPHHRRRLDSRGATVLRDALQTFGIGIQGEIEAFPGPVITRYEFRPAPGVKVNQVVGLADDIALALSASRVRIVAPVPGKAAVGIEVPNSDPELVYLRRVLESDAYHDSHMSLPLALGEAIDGSPFVADLVSMPHLLIAGATGSGKSVCINIIVASILFRHHPKDVRLLFIDPKRLELSVYAGIPHMARPVVTQPKAAERLLSDATKEMDERYKRLAGKGVRNIVDYNRAVKEEERLPYLVIVVDELADLMMSSSASRIELLITRLAQMARAVGIHLILATQRPSVDVITGLIKANFSCRIAFQVASKTDSRTILDANGAEKLLGRGDMLYLAPGQPEALRVHGAFISSLETSSIIEHLKSQEVESGSLPGVVGSGKAASSDEDHGDGEDDPTSDPLFLQAAEVVCRHKQGSVSLLQRRCGIGYQRAARLIDRLEEAGIVGPYDGSKAREVLVSIDELEKRYARPVGS